MPASSEPESTRATGRGPVPRLLFAVVRPFRLFFRTQAAGGILLIAATALALTWANSGLAGSYEGLLHLPVSVSFGGRGLEWPLHHWINDALMSVFFLVAGMEIKRELRVGELRTIRRATLPAIAAAGGMVVPALIHFAINRGGPGANGWGIPMATDIAFALGCIALVSRRVPSSLVVFLMALAIFDDLGAILVIALFYGGQIDVGALGVAAAITVVLATFTWSKVTSVWPYVVLGVALWVAVLRSGIHPTIAGVVLGLCIPARGRRSPRDVLDDLDQVVARLRRSRDRELDATGPLGALERHLESVQAPVDRMLHGLHPWVAFLVVPLFAIANAGVAVGSGVSDLATEPASLGVFFGLLLGKPLGVFGATFVCVRLGFTSRPTGASWAQVLGASLLAGIGFTMSIFVASLAFPGRQDLQDASKVGIFAASFMSAVLGLVLLRVVGKPEQSLVTDEDLDVVIDVPRYAEGFHVETWVARGAFVGRTLRDLGLRQRFGVNVLGTHVEGSDSSAERALQPVGPDDAIAEGDKLVLVGTREAIEAFLAGAGEAERAERPGEYGAGFVSIPPSAMPPAE